MTGQDPKVKAAVAAVVAKMSDEGRLIEAGWHAMRVTVIPAGASDVQITEMHKAYFAGAQHLFASLMSILDPDDGLEPTEQDMTRVELIAKELDAFIEELKAEIGR